MKFGSLCAELCALGKVWDFFAGVLNHCYSIDEVTLHTVSNFLLDSEL